MNTMNLKKTYTNIARLSQIKGSFLDTSQREREQQKWVNRIISRRCHMEVFSCLSCVALRNGSHKLFEKQTPQPLEVYTEQRKRRETKKRALYLSRDDLV